MPPKRFFVLVSAGKRAPVLAALKKKKKKNMMKKTIALGIAGNTSRNSHKGLSGLWNMAIVSSRVRQQLL